MAKKKNLAKWQLAIWGLSESRSDASSCYRVLGAFQLMAVCFSNTIKTSSSETDFSPLESLFQTQAEKWQRKKLYQLVKAIGLLKHQCMFKLHTLQIISCLGTVAEVSDLLRAYWNILLIELLCTVSICKSFNSRFQWITDCKDTVQVNFLYQFFYFEYGLLHVFFLNSLCTFTLHDRH